MHESRSALISTGIHRYLHTAIYNEEVGFSTSDRRYEEGHLLFHALSLKGVGDLFIGVDFKREKEEIGMEDLFCSYCYNNIVSCTTGNQK